MEKKKNSKHYIIPPSYFKKKGLTPIPVTVPPKATENKVLKDGHLEEKAMPEKKEIPEAIANLQVKEPPKIILKQENKRTSGLSLSSIKAKKEHQIRQMDVLIDEQNLPKDPFTENQLVATWNEYVGTIEDKGQYNLASILRIDTPKLKGTTIHLEFPNATNKVEVERQQYGLLAFIRKALNNFDINLSITVNEVLEKKYAYTSKDKFEKLKSKNPNIETLRKTFNLDI